MRNTTDLLPRKNRKRKVSSGPMICADIVRPTQKGLFLFALLSVCLLLLSAYAAGEQNAPKTTPPRESVKPVTPPPPTATPIIVSKNLIANGDFEKKLPDYPSAQAWRLCDGLVFFHEKVEGRGYVLRIDTTVVKGQARERWKVMDELGIKAPPAPKKIPYDDPYATVGGVDGAAYWSDAIPVKKGLPYKLCLDTRGKTTMDLFFTKIFLKGYTNVVKKRNVRQPDGSVKEETQVEERQMYEWYLACRNPEDTWEHFEAWTQSAIPQNIDFVKVFIYAYWPLHDYWFDNVALYEGKYPAENK